MRRKNKEINIFSMSALDLFASAMGAFILIAVVALPYYLKTDHNLMAENKTLQAINEKKEKENQLLKEQATAMQQQLEDMVQFALLGIMTEAKSFVVVIDMSGSMKEYTSILKDTFLRIVEPLDQATMQVIGYQGEVPNYLIHSWNQPRAMLAMNSSNKGQAIAFVTSLTSKFDGGTPTEVALVEALNYDAEAIILLSDGQPNSDPSNIVTNITRLNAGKKEIHTVAIGNYLEDKKLVEFLQALANKNKGAFLGISNI